MSETKVIIPKARASYANLWEPATAPGATKAKYSVSLIISKDDKSTLEKVRAAIDAAAEVGKAANGGKMPKVWKNPLRDGDAERDDDAYANSYFLNANSEQQPGISRKVAGKVEAITDEREVYSGCYLAASLNMYWFDVSGNKGVACGLNNVLKVADGERLGGGRTKPEDDFAEIEVVEDDIEDLLK